MNLLDVLKKNLNLLFDLLKTFLNGKTVISRSHKNLDEGNSSYQIPNSAIILVALMLAGLILLARHFQL